MIEENLSLFFFNRLFFTLVLGSQKKMEWIKDFPHNPYPNTMYIDFPVQTPARFPSKLVHLLQLMSLHQHVVGIQRL